MDRINSLYELHIQPLILQYPLLGYIQQVILNNKGKILIFGFISGFYNLYKILRSYRDYKHKKKTELEKKGILDTSTWD